MNAHKCFYNLNISSYEHDRHQHL